MRVGVDQQRDVDPVAGYERQPLERVAPGCDLAGEGLHDRGQLGIEHVEQRPGGQLGHPAAAVGKCGLALTEGPAVEPLDERDRRRAQERAEQAADVVRAKLLGVGVEEADDLAAQHP